MLKRESKKIIWGKKERVNENEGNRKENGGCGIKNGGRVGGCDENCKDDNNFKQ